MVCKQRFAAMDEIELLNDTFCLGLYTLIYKVAERQTANLFGLDD